MHLLILWSGFLGAWLLVIGPLDQAAQELREEEVEQDRVRATMASVDAPAPVSPWLLLLPPLWWWRRHQRREAFRHQVMQRLEDEDYEALTSFVRKARGWVLVGTGGLLIAAKETWELVEGYEWPTAVFWLLVVLGLAVAVGNLVGMARAQQDDRRRRTAARAR